MCRHPLKESSKEASMKLKLIVAISALAVMPAFGQGTKGGGPPANVPKPTMAEVQKVVQTISADKTKMQTYCELSQLNQQMAKLDEKKDATTLQSLGQKADGLVQKLGPDYTKMMDGLEQVDEKSDEAKQIGAALDSLDKQCT
jgi:hypothetical protein